MGHGGLHAERDPGEPTPGEGRQTLRRHRVGVRLDRHLGRGGQGEPAPDGVEDRDEVGRPEHRRSAAADEHGVDGGPGLREDVGREVDLAQRRREVARGDVPAGRPGRQLAEGVGVEVAVAAPYRAERHVDVHPERTLPERVEGRCRELAAPRRRVALGEPRHASHPVIRPAPGRPRPQPRTVGRLQRPEPPGGCPRPVTASEHVIPRTPPSSSRLGVAAAGAKDYTYTYATASAAAPARVTAPVERAPELILLGALVHAGRRLSSPNHLCHNTIGVSQRHAGGGEISTDGSRHRGCAARSERLDIHP